MLMNTHVFNYDLLIDLVTVCLLNVNVNTLIKSGVSVKQKLFMEVSFFIHLVSSQMDTC